LSNNLINCAKISVDCIKNDSVDIRCGGPEYLGFDFFVKASESEEMQKFIFMTLKTFELPLLRMNIGDSKEMKEDVVWTKERIASEINKEAAYLKSQMRANSAYSSFKK